MGWPRNDIKNFLEGTGVKRVLFIPYAGVSVSYNDYEAEDSRLFLRNWDMICILSIMNQIRFTR